MVLRPVLYTAPWLHNYCPMTASTPSRLAYIDWMRGLACVLMFQTHCYDSWLGGNARKSTFFMWSQLGGTLPAPLFLFLAGISFALVTDKLRQKGVPANQIARTTIRRGAEIFGLGLLFRLQEYRDRLGLGAVERLVARGHPQHNRPFHDVNGRGLLDGLTAQLGIAAAVCAGHDGGCFRDEHFPFDRR